MLEKKTVSPPSSSWFPLVSFHHPPPWLERRIVATTVTQGGALVHFQLRMPGAHQQQHAWRDRCRWVPWTSDGFEGGKRMDSGSFLRHVLFIVYLKEGIHVGILDFQKKWKDSYKKRTTKSWCFCAPLDIQKLQMSTDLLQEIVKSKCITYRRFILNSNIDVAACSFLLVYSLNCYHSERATVPSCEELALPHQWPSHHPIIPSSSRLYNAQHGWRNHRTPESCPVSTQPWRPFGRQKCKEKCTLTVIQNRYKHPNESNESLLWHLLLGGIAQSTRH